MDWSELGDAYEGFDLTDFPSLDVLQIRQAKENNTFWYFYNTLKNNYCKYFIIGKLKKVKRKVTVYFIQKPGTVKLVPRFTFDVVNDPEILQSKYVKARVGLNEDDTRCLLYLTNFISKMDEVDVSTSQVLSVTSADKSIVDLVQRLAGQERIDLLTKVANDLSDDEVNVVLGRKKALEVFRRLLDDKDYFNEQMVRKEFTQPEKLWQAFFEKEKWIFGLALQLKFLEPLDREMPITTERADKVIVDFLMQSDYTATVEIKLPSTPLFSKVTNRSGAWKLSGELNDAVSQVLEQKAEWMGFAYKRETIYSAEKKALAIKRTRDSQAFLVIGNKVEEISGLADGIEKIAKLDTLELFRRNMRNVEVVTYDELYNRAEIILGG